MKKEFMTHTLVAFLISLVMFSLSKTKVYADMTTNALAVVFMLIVMSVIGYFLAVILYRGEEFEKKY